MSGANGKTSQVFVYTGELTLPVDGTSLCSFFQTSGHFVQCHEEIEIMSSFQLPQMEIA